MLPYLLICLQKTNTGLGNVISRMTGLYDIKSDRPRPICSFIWLLSFCDNKLSLMAALLLNTFSSERLYSEEK